MSNKFLDSVGHYNTAQINQKYDIVGLNGGFPTVGSTGARSSTGALSFGVASYCDVTVPAYKTYILGMALSFRSNVSANFNLLCMRDSAGGISDTSIQSGLYISPDGALHAYRGNFAVLGATASGAYPTSVGPIHYLEFKVTVASATGAISVQVDGNSVLALTSLNTQSTTNPYVNSVQIGDMPAIGTSISVCDIYINDDQGTQNTGFEGDTGVFLLPMASDGTFQNWTTVGAGTHTGCVSMNPTDDSKYVVDQNPTDRDTYIPGTLSGILNQPLSLQLVTRAEKDASGSHSYQQNVRSGTTDAFSSTITMGVGYHFDRMIQETDPATGSRWASMAAVQGAQYGQKLIS